MPAARIAERGINDVGMIVGASGSAFGTRAFLWTQSGGLRDLNDFVLQPSTFVLVEAVAINNSGTILAIGRDATLDPHDEHDAHELPIRVFLLVP